MKKTLKIIIFFIFTLTIFFLVIFLIEKKLKVAQVCFQEDCFLVGTADTSSKQQWGLMFRESLERDGGMLFVFKKEGNYPFWMQNTLIPLDIIWIDQNQEIVFIKENAQPCREVCIPIDPKQNAKYVLEINGGVASEINLKIGDKTTIFW